MKSPSDGYLGKTVLITGGAGAIGSNLCRSLVSRARKVVVLDDFSSARSWNLPSSPGLALIRGSVTDPKALLRAFQHKPDVVFHLAAHFANQRSVDHPEKDLETNGLGTLRVLDAARRRRAGRVVYASSGCAFGGSSSHLPILEDSPAPPPTTPYQITKLLGERYADFFLRHYGLKIVKARLFNSYGPGEIPGHYRNVIPNFIYRALRGESLPITGSPDATRDFTFVEDIVAGLLLAGLSTRAVGEAVNIASGRQTRVGRIAEEINRITGSAAGAVLVPRRSWDAKDRVRASVEKARRLLGYEPRTPLEEGLRRTVAWFRSNWHRIQAGASFDEPSPALAARA